MFYKCALRPAGFASPHFPAHTPTRGLIFLFSTSLANYAGLKKKKKGILFSFAFLWSLVMLSTCHIFISHLWFPLLSASFVRFPIKAPIFSLMIYKSSECTCFPEARPSCAGSLSGCYADVPVAGASLHGHRCPGLSEERVGSVTMVIPKLGLAPLPLTERLAWPQC